MSTHRSDGAPGSKICPLNRFFAKHGTAVSVDVDEMLTLDGEPVTRLYVVRSGMIRLCTNSEDGRRHVFAFVQAAGLVGFPSINRHHFTAEAVIPSRLQSVSQADLAEQLIGNVELLEAERGLLRKALRMREEHALRVASLPADQRLLSFLTDYAENAAPDMRREHGLVYLPMPRRDLADHLGLTLETVSRSFGILKRRGEIEMQGSGRFRIARHDVFLKGERSAVL